MFVLDCHISKKEWVHEARERNRVSIAQHGAESVVEDELAPWEPAVQKIVGYQHLGHDWDGFRAKAPSLALLASAVGLAYLLSERGVEPPHRVAPGVDGSVTLEWQFPDGTYADVEIVQPLNAKVMVIEPGQPAGHWTLPNQ